MRLYLALLALAACGSPEDAPLHLHASDPALRAELVVAASEWNACRGREAIVDDPSSPDDDAVEVLGVEPADPRLSDHVGATLVHHGGIGASYAKHILLPEGHAQNDATHEVGHALTIWLAGTAHQHFGQGIMNADPVVPHVTDEDCVELRKPH